MLSLLSIPIAAQTMNGGARAGGGAVVGIPGGTLTISLTGSTTATDTTIVQSFASSLFTTSTLECTPTAGGAAVNAPDNNVGYGLSHQQGVSGLTPSTAYTCQAAVTNGSTVTSTFTATTTATTSPTAITGISFTTPTSIQTVGACNSVADTFYNFTSSDGNTYSINDDTQGWQCSGVPSLRASGSNVSLIKFNSSTPTGQTTNFLTGMGTAGQPIMFDGNSAKGASLFGQQGYLFMWVSGQQNLCCGVPPADAGYPQTGGSLMTSYDHGATWNNFQNLTSYTPNGAPGTAAMFATNPTGTMGSCQFVVYGPDDGTNGYLQTVNQIDNANLYTYLICNDGWWNNGNSYYLFRVPRAKLIKASAGDYQAFTGGDGNLDANWSSTLTGATAILTNTGKLSWAAIRHIPGRGYLLFTFYYPLGLGTGGSANNSVWLTYYIGPHLWSSPTLIDTENWPTLGYYNPIPVEGTLSGPSFTVLFTDSFSTGGTYTPSTSTATWTP